MFKFLLFTIQIMTTISVYGQDIKWGKKSKIYEYYQIDTPPKQMNGNPLRSVTIEKVSPCFSEPMNVDINAIAIIVTKDGTIKNIEQALGSLSDNCPATMQLIIKEVSNWGKLIPATRKGKKVNARWFIKVNNLDRKEVHPAIEDNKKNRKKYIRRKKKNG